MNQEKPTQRKKKPSNFSGVKHKEQIISAQCWVNKATGEERIFNVVEREGMSDFGFHKVWIDDLSRIIGVLGGSKVKVFSYILSNLNPISNQFGGTIREVAEILKINKVTVQSTISILLAHGFMRRVRSGTYQVSASVLVKGTHEKRVGLMLTYDKLNYPELDLLYSGSDI